MTSADGMTLTDRVRELLTDALRAAQADGRLPDVAVDEVTVERPQNPEHGDFATSTPLKLARVFRRNPFDIAEAIASSTPTGGILASAEAVRPGFVNLRLNPTWLAEQVDVIRQAGDFFGSVDDGNGTRVQVEFVSVNPTGPIHVGHGRGAVFGSSLASVLEAAGYDVQREYYINDAGNQMDRFNQSLFARYQQQYGKDAQVPEDGYLGEYMIDLARDIIEEDGRIYLDMSEDESVSSLGDRGLKWMTTIARDDMRDLRVVYDNWFTERSLYENGQFDRAMALLDDSGLLTERNGATWFKSTSLGDEEDKVMVRSTGAPTYFATDIAYHYNKFLERGFDRVIDVLGADHQGHVRFMNTVPLALGIEAGRLQLLIYQLVTLKRAGEAVRFSKRAGQVVTLRELVDEVGADACRFFFLQRAPDSQMEFDIELAKEQSDKNPVYYIQYAHARIASILRLADDRGIDYADGDVSLLTHEAELSLVHTMLRLPELISMMARNLEPHHLTYYSMDLATDFHNFYQQCRVVSSDPADAEITRARLKLAEATKTVLARCLTLMGMTAPEAM